ncbi:MAG TPA: DUF2065 family protein [Sphingobium sp.]|nr:DUF2065 family protein [Sphingobium sp.]
MITTVSTLTLTLAQAMGLYLILIGLSGLAGPHRWKAVMDELAASAALQILMGVTVFAIGVALAMAHSHLTDPLAIIVTVIGWIALIEGALLIAVPGPLLRIGHWSLGFTRIWAIVSLILGILLGLAGLTGTASTAHFV